MRRAALGSTLLLALCVALSPAPSRGQDEAGLKARGAAIDKGVAWLKKQQAADGSFDDAFAPFGGVGHMKLGTTALAALALLKAGVAPDDKQINAAFDFMANTAGSKIDFNYSAGTILMAIEARINWEPPHLDEGEDAPTDGTHEKKAPPKPVAKKGKASGRDLELAKACVEFLTKNQGELGWTYPPAANGFREDVSNTQYALLGLDAAEHLGLDVPKGVYEKAQEFLTANQEKEGPDVTPFAVPGADLSYKELKKIETETRAKLKQIEGAFKGKKPGDVNAEGHTEADERRTTEEDAAKKIIKTVSAKAKMKARGWGYAFNKAPGGGGRPGGGPDESHPTGSMTTAGLACLFICKAHLDGTKTYEKALKGPIDKAIRDGCGWMAKNFSVTQNPPGGQHHLYYLYGLERAGVLLLVPKFGEHEWYDEGARLLVKDQAGEGSWNAGNQGTVGPMCDTCFALLFLARGTTPIVRIPTRTATGPGSAGEKPQPQESPKPEGGK